MIVAGFASERELQRALDSLASEPVRLETYTPSEMNKKGADSAVSPLPLVMLASALLGGVGFFALQSYANLSAYPVNIGGRPDFSWPAFVVNAFEVGVLCAMAAGFAAYLIANRMPTLYEQADECDELREASRDGWFLSVRGGSDMARVRALLDSVGPVALKELPE